MNKPIEKPILFSGPMVRAILDGKKTMTRRPIKFVKRFTPEGIKRFIPDYLGKPTWVFTGTVDGNPAENWIYPKYAPNTRLWVRETWAWGKRYDDCIITLETIPKQKPDYAEIFYRADNNQVNRDDKWKPSIFMPRWASRITLEIVSVRVERLQEITEEDARSEGVFDGGCLNCGGTQPCGCDNPVPDARDSFIWLWDSLNGKTYPWKDNPFVWVIEFRRIDAL